MRWLSFILAFLISSALDAQVLVEGFIRDELGQAIPFAHIALKHRELEGAVSKVNGFFSVEIDHGDTLVFSHVGFKPLEIEADSVFNDRYINVTLPADFVQLEAVYVLANNKYKVPERYVGQPYEVSGVEKRTSKNPIKAGSLRAGGATPDPGVPLTGPSLVWHGPLSFFAEKEQRKAAAAAEDIAETFTFSQFINDTDVRDSLMARYAIEEDALSILLIRYNQTFPQVQTFTNTDDIWISITDFLDRQKTQ